MQITLGGLILPLEEDFLFSSVESSATVTQRDFINATMNVMVNAETRKALQSIAVSDGEHLLNQWTGPNKGTYVGAWSKRLSKYVYKTHNIKLNPQVVSVISERISKTIQGLKETLYLRFSVEPWKPGEYGEKTNSCWWSSYEYARIGLFESGQGAALKIFDSSHLRRARCWVYNIEDSLLAFNAYDIEDKLNILSIARILSLKFGMDYRKHTNVIMPEAYVNGKSIYAIGNPPIERPIALDFAQVKKTSPPRLHSEIVPYIPMSNMVCIICSGDRSDAVWIAGKSYCGKCASKCEVCSKLIVNYISPTMDTGSKVCNECASNMTLCIVCDRYRTCENDECAQCSRIVEFACQICDDPIDDPDEEGHVYRGQDDEYVCNSCCFDSCFICNSCEDLYSTDDSCAARNSNGSLNICEACKSYGDYVTCPFCSDLVHVEITNTVHDTTFCYDCTDDVATLCGRCEELEWIDGGSEVRVGDFDEDWCEYCADEYSSYCDVCDMRYPDIDNHNHEDE